MPSIKPLHLNGKDIRRAGPGDFVGPEHGGTGVTSLAELKEELNLSSVDNTSDADKPISTAVALALADKASVGAPAQAINDARGAPNGIAALGSDGKIPESQLPSIAIVDAFVVADQAEMLALTVQRGDMAIRMDLEATFVMAGDTNILANWIQLRTPSGAVLSVAGKVGNIILAAADVGLGNVDDTSDADKPLSTATAAALNLKQGKEAGKGLSSNDYTNADKTKLEAVKLNPEVVSAIVGGSITPGPKTDEIRPQTLVASLNINNPTSNPEDGFGFIVELLDDGVKRGLTWGSKFASRYHTLPVETVPGKFMLLGFKYEASTDKIYLMAKQIQS